MYFIPTLLLLLLLENKDVRLACVARSVHLFLFFMSSNKTIML